MVEASKRLLNFIDRSPTPWHAVASIAQWLQQAGFRRYEETEDWQIAPGACGYVVRDGGSIIAFRLGQTDAPMRIIGAHTDSPGFRVKPRGAFRQAGFDSLGIEVYGDPIIATFADRDLTLAGRIMVEDRDKGISTRLVNLERPLLRLPNLAIHLNRDVNQAGLRFDLQDELPLVLGCAAEQLPAEEGIRQLLGAAAGVAPETILSWELAVVDVQPGAFFGRDNEFIASARLDNLASCHAAVEALLAAEPGQTQVIALFDHEEVGSQSYKGADGTFLADVLARLAECLGLRRESERRSLHARSVLLSADMAHALHPNVARVYEPQHHVHLNGGPVIKINAQQRYATDGVGEAYFEWLCRKAEIPCQKYVHRTNLPCGSTIGPIAAGRLGIRTIDVGNPMWSMHSARESAGAHDHGMMIKVMTLFFSDATELPS
ncbi:MAG: M18 family aminopeptidase [Xanthomonadaceae bacterium]|nr:M18 family aminopeptidase [Xanthomonadaceae bacterium]